MPRFVISTLTTDVIADVVSLYRYDTKSATRASSLPLDLSFFASLVDALALSSSSRRFVVADVAVADDKVATGALKTKQI